MESCSCRAIAQIAIDDNEPDKDGICCSSWWRSNERAEVDSGDQASPFSGYRVVISLKRIAERSKSGWQDLDRSAILFNEMMSGRSEGSLPDSDGLTAKTLPSTMRVCIANWSS